MSIVTNYGNPVFNLAVEMDVPASVPAESVENYGNAITIAKRHLLGARYVTSNGYLLSGTQPGLHAVNGVLYIEHSWAGLRLLQQLLDERTAERRIPDEWRSRTPESVPGLVKVGAHFHYRGGGIAEIIIHDEDLLVSDFPSKLKLPPPRGPQTLDMTLLSSELALSQAPRRA